MEKTNAYPKNTELVSVLKPHFEKMNLNRIKFLAYFLTSLCKLRTVNFERLANGFSAEAKSESSLRRIQRFIAGFALDRDIIARLIFGLLPEQQKLTLSIDRSNWKFGKANINIFMLGIAYQGVAFPLLFSMLPKRGNSSTPERIELIERFIRLFGKTVSTVLWPTGSLWASLGWNTLTIKASGTTSASGKTSKCFCP
jgi:hypothetical protein